ncbi:MAG: cobaltochelatase subunit CobN, partial [Bacillota bacterium]
NDTVYETVYDVLYSAVFNTIYYKNYAIVYNAVYYTGDETVSTTVYENVYDSGAEAQNSTEVQPVETVSETVSETVYLTAYDTVYGTVYESVYDNVYNNAGDQPAAEKSGPKLFPGTFTSTGDYLDWYRETGRLKEGGPWIGIIAFDSFFKNDDMDMYVKLLESLEAKGANVILVFTNTANKKNAVEQFFMKADGSSRIDFLVAAMGFNFIYGSTEAGVELFKRLNVPVMAPVYTSNLDDWENNPAGISSEVPWQIAYPELDGRIEPVLMGGSRVVAVDVYTGAVIEKKLALPNRIERVAGRVLSWANLRNEPNADKKIALVYYNHDGGKDGIGAAYLNVTKSVYQVLQALQDDGYLVEGDITAESLAKTMFEKGRNIGSWAPGELDTLMKAGVMTVPGDKYLEWYQMLPQQLRDQVEQEWGPPPGNIMVHNGELVIPGAKIGNIFIGPQPMRGWADDPAKIAHSPSLPPPHQYIAFYLWLQKEYGADAVIHLGTHGTLEWLPGRSVGLGEDDWPDALIGNMPDIYPYIVNNPGEGTQAKRRGYAVTIGHLTPPMIKPALYGELAELQRLITDYQSELSKETSSRLGALQQEITAKIRANSLDQVLDIKLNEEDFTRVISPVEKYLEEFTAELMPYGLHTFGLAPEGELLELMTDSIVSYDEEARKDCRDEIRGNLMLSTNEMTNLLRVLRGEYIEPGLARDPVRVPEVMPTGRNLVSFDPRMVPDKIAWETGKKIADQLLEQYKAEKGRYPETVGVVLWAIETMRTQGESVAMILRLIGAEPVWDSTGKVSKVKITPVETLGRPRIDVVVTISGLFRDTFAHTVNVLDDAFRQIALLDESPDNNLVRKHYQELKETLKAGGMSDADADSLATARIFGEPPGTYGTGVSELVKATGAWENQQELTDVYMSRMSHVYGRTSYGKPATEAFQQLLKNVEAVVQVRDSLWGVLDNDDVYQYLGGLKLAAEAASGHKVKAYIANTRNAANPAVQTLERFLTTELITRVLNPEWIKGMLKEGSAGSREITDHIANLFGVDSTLDAVDDRAWQKVADTLIFDETVRSQLDPYALQALIGWNMEAARRNMWNADPETLAKLADLYIQNAADYGVVCCHHTCANLKFNEWMADYSTLDNDTLAKFKDVFDKATNKELQIQSRPVTSPSTSTSDSSANSGSLTLPPAMIGQEEQKADPEQQSPEQQPVKPAENAQKMSGQEGRQEIPFSSEGLSASGREQVAMQSSTESGNAGTGPEAAQKPNQKAYEIEPENNGKSAGGGAKGVTVFAILGAMAIVAVFAKGYLFK